MMDWIRSYLHRHKRSVNAILSFASVLAGIVLGVLIPNNWEKLSGLFNDCLSYICITIILIKILFDAVIFPSIDKLYDTLLRENKAYENLLKDISENVGDNLNGLVKQCFEDLGIVNIADLRLTLYSISGQICRVMSRYSGDRSLMQTNSTSHPLSKGCIKYGHNMGFHFDNAFPCPVTDPNAYDDYLRQTAGEYQYEFTHADCKKLKHKNRCYAVKSVYKTDKMILGILVLESRDKDAFTPEMVKDKMTAFATKMADFLYISKMRIDLLAKQNADEIIDKKKKHKKSKNSRKK